MATPTPTLISLTTVFSLLATLAILITAYVVSLRLLPSTTSKKLRIIYIWHLFDALIHFILEGSFLYLCFTAYTDNPSPQSTSDYPHPASLGASNPLAVGARVVHFLGHDKRLYGARYGTSPFAKLWQEYARADARWGEADLTVISLELLTVFGAGPLALYITDLICKGAKNERAGGKLWFWATVLATGELYGGFMTFAPEWLSGSVNLDTSNFMYLWIYLVFFNMLWVWFPLWILYEAYGNITAASANKERKEVQKKRA